MWCDELSKQICKEIIIKIDNKLIHHSLNNNGEVVTKEIKDNNCLNSKGEVVTKEINKEDKSENNYFDIEERDIKLVMDKTNLNRERAIKELQKNDIVTILMNYLDNM